MAKISIWPARHHMNRPLYTELFSDKDQLLINIPLTSPKHIYKESHTFFTTAVVIAIDFLTTNYSWPKVSLKIMLKILWQKKYIFENVVRSIVSYI